MAEAQYNSAEDMQAYKSKLLEVSEQYPTLISGLTNVSSITFDTIEAEKQLALARQQSASSAYEAAKKEREAAQLEYQKQKEDRKEGLAGYYQTGWNQEILNKVPKGVKKEDWEFLVKSIVSPLSIKPRIGDKHSLNGSAVYRDSTGFVMGGTNILREKYYNAWEAAIEDDRSNYRDNQTYANIGYDVWAEEITKAIYTEELPDNITLGSAAQYLDLIWYFYEDNENFIKQENSVLAEQLKAASDNIHEIFGSYGNFSISLPQKNIELEDIRQAIDAYIKLYNQFIGIEELKDSRSLEQVESAIRAEEVAHFISSLSNQEVTFGANSIIKNNEAIAGRVFYKMLDASFSNREEGQAFSSLENYDQVSNKLLN